MGPIRPLRAFCQIADMRFLPRGGGCSQREGWGKTCGGAVRLAQELTALRFRPWPQVRPHRSQRRFMEPINKVYEGPPHVVERICSEIFSSSSIRSRAKTHEHALMPSPRANAEHSLLYDHPGRVCAVQGIQALQEVNWRYAPARVHHGSSMSAAGLGEQF